MKVHFVALSLLFAACFMQTPATVLYCNTSCAACWKTGEQGIDIVRATAVGRDAERKAERNAVLAGDPKGLDYYVILL